jgi:hypothetical protein
MAGLREIKGIRFEHERTHGANAAVTSKRSPPGS